MAHVLQILCTNSAPLRVEMTVRDKWNHAMHLMEKKEAATDAHTKRELDRLAVDELGPTSQVNRLFQMVRVRPFVHRYQQANAGSMAWKSLLEIMRSDLAPVRKHLSRRLARLTLSRPRCQQYHLHHMDRFATAFHPLLDPSAWGTPGNKGKKRKAKQRPRGLKRVLGSGFKDAAFAAYKCMLEGGDAQTQRALFRDTLMQSKDYDGENYPQAFWDAVDWVLDGKGMVYTISIALKEQKRLAGWSVLLYFVRTDSSRVACSLAHHVPLDRHVV